MAETCETQDTLVSNSGGAKACLAGPRPSQMLAVPSYLVCRKPKYSNKTVKYSIIAITVTM